MILATLCAVPAIGFVGACLVVSAAELARNGGIDGMSPVASAGFLLVLAVTLVGLLPAVLP